MLNFTEPHDYALKKSANFKIKDDRNWVRRSTRN